ncbi:UTP--glucose-1-phosphate uridylyltransferase [Akkermansiaceae bacterium]|nr:UTP--glucose-1-phosphate uridylyltransferase [Akkermansiaceae bacterium]MDA7888327.1 UTP--glucose-1-phosphate uridylyltransferase [Akkermansiaceae bacterium]MDB4544621.1 UTP--glucose-1-phosphate uridylyltransferase [Akkermansiaceae bacterium]
MSDAVESMKEKMREKGVMDAAIKAFERARSLVEKGGTGELSESDIISAEGVSDYGNLEKQTSMDPELLARTVVIKLNGGLGTGMGLEKVKSLLEVRPGVAFLDLMSRQILALRKETGSEVRFLLMNSQASSQDTQDYLASSVPEIGDPSQLELMQNWVPKLRQDNLSPVSFPENPDLELCPPGHADVYPSLVGSGWLEKLLSDGVKYAFISNSDNLGAVLDATLLSHFAQSGAPFLMEVTRRTDADRKGGHLATRTADGRLVLREVAQCPAEDLESFQNIDKHQYFNTNNIWVNLVMLKEVMEAADGVLPLPVIVNKKPVNPRDASSTPVYQLEQAMGSAIECFDGAAAVNVPRSRFAPVKTTGDLFALRSDAYQVSDDGKVRLDPARHGVPPVVDLSSEYKLVDGLATLGVPSLIDTKKITVSGPMSFEPGVVVKGEVSFVNDSSEPKSVAAGTYESTSVSL